MINIYIFAFNRPDLLSLQIDCLKKFLKDKFIINVIHDSRNGENRDDFIEVCNKYQDIKINYYDHRSPVGLTASQYHSLSLQWVYDNLIEVSPNKICLFLDHDIFPICDLNLISDLENLDIIGLEQDRGGVKYVWPGLVIFRSSSFNEMTWSCGVYYGQTLDTGGGISAYLRSPSIRYKSYEVSYPDSYRGFDLTDEKITFGYNFELHYGEKFLHSRNACNWDVQYNLRDSDKTELLVSIIQDILNG
jgi:hypothetical protein